MAILLVAASPDETVPLASRLAFNVWLMLKPGRAAEVHAFERYVALHGAAGIFPLHHLMRSESHWARCGQAPFVVAPRALWPNIVNTLRFIRDRVRPRTGPLEVLSGYRARPDNACAGGASQSAHIDFWALDLVPASALARTEMIARLCTVHAAYGQAANVGLGFYRGRRFHVDTKQFRRWGTDRSGGSSPCGAISR
jgi:hypothetical protein